MLSIIELIFLVYNLIEVVLNNFSNVNLMKYAILINLIFVTLFISVSSLYIIRIFKNIIRNKKYVIEYNKTKNI